MRKLPGVASIAATLVAPLLFVSQAAANGRFPASNQIVFSPTDPNVIFGRATFAMFPSTDDGATWSYLCEELLDLPTGSTNYEDPELAFTANGNLVAGLSQPTTGLSVSTDLGCTWACSSSLDATRQVVDTVVRPNMKHEVLALVSDIVDGGYLTPGLSEHRRRRDLVRARSTHRPGGPRDDHRRRNDRSGADLRLRHTR